MGEEENWRRGFRGSSGCCRAPSESGGGSGPRGSSGRWGIDRCDRLFCTAATST